MKAVIADKYGTPDVLEYREVPQPKIKPNHLLIKMHATSVNPLDFRIRRGELRIFTREALKGKLLILDRQPAITLRDFFNEYDKWLSDNKAYNTYSRVHRIIPKFLDAVGSQTLIHTLDFNNLDTYVAYCKERGNSAITINLEIRHIKAAFTWGVSRKYLKSTPFKGYEELPENKKDPQFLTIEQIQKVFDAISNRKYRLIFALYVYTGARREEIWRLEWKDIKEDVVMIRKTKNYKPREVPISENLKKILDEHARGVGLLFNVSLDQMGRRIKYYLRKAGIGYLRPHDLRHTFASHLIMAGVDLKTVGTVRAYQLCSYTNLYPSLKRA